MKNDKIDSIFKSENKNIVKARNKLAEGFMRIINTKSEEPHLYAKYCKEYLEDMNFLYKHL